jgi:hypothetical protein
MADKKISELTETTNPASTDVLPISHGEDTYKVSADNLIIKTPLTGLQTTATTVPGAINELKNGQNFTAIQPVFSNDHLRPSRNTRLAQELLRP